MLNGLFGITIKEGPRTTDIVGVNYRSFNDDIVIQFGTTTPGKYMFRRVNYNKFTTDNFFLLELEFLITQLLQSKNIRSRRRDIYDLQTKLRSETWIKDTLDPKLELINVNELKRVFKFTPYPSQLDFLSTYRGIKESYHLKGLLLDALPGSGKAQPLYSKIKVPGGWATMGSMQVGDKVIAADGTTTKVIGVFPQGKTKLVRVHFKDGRTVDCNPEHLWNVQTKILLRTKNPDFRTVDTNWIRERLNNPEDRVYVQLNRSEQTTDKSFRIHPYVMGVLLGDGGISGESVLISKPHQQLMDKVQSLIPDWMECKWQNNITFSIVRKKGNGDKPIIKTDLEELGLQGTRSWEKFIPHDYFNGSTQQRLELLQGLLDTDGTVGKKKCISFSSTSKRLAEGVQYLVRSLGGIAKISERTPHYTYKGERKEGRTDYRVFIRYPRPEELFTLEHKKERATKTQYSDILKLEIIKVEDLPDQETQCIRVEHPDQLYVTDNFVVTHNTPISLWWTYLNRNAKHIIICPNSTVETVWLKHIQEKLFINAPKVWSTRQGTTIDPTADYFIFHNEFVRSDSYMKAVSDVFKAAGGKGVDLIVDECHNFNDLNSKQTQNLIESCDSFPFNDTLPMSGTPLKGMAKEAYTVFALIDNFFKGNARERFNKSYGLSRDKLNTLLARRIGRLKYTIEALVGMQHEEPDIEVRKVKFKGAEDYTLKAVRLRMLDYIKDRIKFYEEQMPYFIEFFNGVLNEYEANIRGDEVAMKRLAEYRRIVTKFRTHGFSSFTDNEDSKFAKSVEIDIEAGLKGERLKTFRNIKSAVKYVGLKIRGEALGLVLGKARMNAVRDTLINADLPGIINDATKKTLIFTSYVDVLEECEQQLLDAGFKPVTIYGENNNLRDISVAKFAKDPSINPAITTFDSLREGVDMTAASTEIFLNAPWRDYEMKQAKARIYRQGQDTAVRYVLIDLDTGTEPNITTRSIDIMEWSREQTDILLGRSSLNKPEFRAVIGGEDFGIIDELETMMIPKATSSALSLFM